VLRSRELLASALATAVAALGLVAAGSPLPAAADPIDIPVPPNCSIATCPTDPPSDQPFKPPADDPGFGTPDPEKSLCKDMLTLPVDPADVADLTVPTGVEGRWAYRLCGATSVVNSIPPSVVTPKDYRDYCADKSCSLVPFWLAKDKDKRLTLPIPDDPGGLGRFFRIWPDAQSNPPDGQLITNFPTWFWDNNNPLPVLGAPIPPIPLPGFPGIATAIHLRSWWEFDGGLPPCESKGVKPHDAVTPEEALQEQPPCGRTFPTAGKHSATAFETWLIIIISFTPPAAVAFTITLDDTIDITVRDVQTDVQGGNQPGAPRATPTATPTS
jgi:hypothetical protein